MIDTIALRKKILDLAISGRLTEQNLEIESAESEFTKLLLRKKELINNKVIKKEKTAELENNDNPFDIPKNWKWCQLADLCKTVTDGTHKTPTYIEQGVPFLSVKNVSSGAFDFEDVKYISEHEHDELLKRCKPEIGDVLFCRIGTLGKAIEIDFEPSFSIFVSLGLIKPLDVYLSKYLVTVFNSGYGDEWIKRNKAGDSMHAAKINLDTLRAFMIPLPPREEQERITNKIYEIFRLLDIIENFQKQYTLNLDVLKSKLTDAGIQGKLTEQLSEDGTAEELFAEIQTEKQQLIKEKKIKKEKALADISEEEIPFEIPSNWKWVRLGELISISSGKGLTANQMKDGNIPVFGGNGITGYHNEAIVSHETVVIGRVGFYCGSVHVTPKKAWVTDNAFITEYPEKYIDRDYLVYVLKFMKLGQRNNGAAQPVVSGKKIYPLLFPLPPLNEQKRIATKLNELLEFI